MFVPFLDVSSLDLGRLTAALARSGHVFAGAGIATKPRRLRSSSGALPPLKKVPDEGHEPEAQE